VKRQFLALLLLFSCCAVSIYGQTTPGDSTNLDVLIEDAITTSDTDAETDWTVITDYLEDLKRKPLDLNSATKNQLSNIPGFSEILINRLFAHIQQNGALTSLFELQAIEGFTEDVFKQIQPFVTVRDAKALDIRKSGEHAAGPSFPDLISGMKMEFIQRYSTTLETQKGYTAPDTNSDGSLTTRYLGGPGRVYTRFRVRNGQNFSFSLLGESDSGEKIAWSPEKKQYGFDFLSGHIALMNYGRIKRVVIGDYNLQLGQGLILSTGLGFGKGVETVNSVKRSNFNIRPYTSVNEATFMRGGAVAYAFGPVQVTAFGSKRLLDANSLNQTDTLENTADFVNSIQTSGQHRTESELENRQTLGETSGGGRVEYIKRNITIGSTVYYQEFDKPFTTGNNVYQKYDFTGSQNLLVGVDYDFVYKNINVFGEVARSSSGGIGGIMGMLAALDPKLEFSLLLRSFDKDFHSFRGFVFAERPREPQNERGAYLGVKIKPNKKHLISAYFDQYYFPWYRYNTDFPSFGYDFLGQYTYTPDKKTEFYVRYRSESKLQNADSLETGQLINQQAWAQRNHIRGQFTYTLNRVIKLRTRAEYSWYNENPGQSQTGYMMYQDFIWDLSYKFKFSTRYAIFDTESYDTRIYVYENDVPTFYTISPYNGKGTRYYVMLNYTPFKGVDLFARYSRTTYTDRETVGSGLDEIEGNHRSDLRVMLRLVF